MNALPANFAQLSEAQQLRVLQDRKRDSESKPVGGLKMITKHDVTGRPIFEFVGDKSWMDAYKSPGRLQVRINNNPRENPFYMAKG